MVSAPRRSFLLAGILGAARVATAARRPPWRTIRFAVRSPLLGQERGIVIHVPPGPYPEEELPVLHFLHGLRDDEDSWEDEGMSAALADAVAAGSCRPLLVATPGGGAGFYTNAWGGGPREEDFILEEVIPEVERRLGGCRSRERRAIAGISMGGYGAVKIALKHPGLFAAAGSLSGSLPPPGESFTGGEGRMSRRLEAIFGPPGDEAMRLANDPYALMDLHPPAAMPSIYVACGTDDRYGFDAGAEALAAALLARGIDAELSLSPGRHAYSYWRRELPRLLSFLDRRLLGAGGPGSRDTS